MSAEPQRDRRVLRRGGIAGAGTGAVVAAVLAVAELAAGAGTRGALAVVALATVFGLLAASAWLLVAALLDLIAGHPPGGARLLVTLAVVVATMLSPMLVLAAGG